MFTFVVRYWNKFKWFLYCSVDRCKKKKEDGEVRFHKTKRFFVRNYN